jgi:AraC-like DNA-binding protein
MSPSQYILARRLVAVRSELIRSDWQETKVAQIALDYGFSHLGRFAGVYRNQFGELPGETLRAD